MSEPVTYVCDKCGSEDVTRDATAAWSFEDQRWELAGCMDAAYCEDCGECNLVEKKVEPELPKRKVWEVP
jgi:ribosomal protein L37AE/L43A